MHLPVMVTLAITHKALSNQKGIGAELTTPQNDGERITEWCSRIMMHGVHYVSRATPGMFRPGDGPWPLTCIVGEAGSVGAGLEPTPTQYLGGGAVVTLISHLVRCQAWNTHQSAHPSTTSASIHIPRDVNRQDGSAVHTAYPRASARPVFVHILQNTPMVPHGWIRILTSDYTADAIR